MPSLTFLGTGSSYGVPSPSCTCSVCRRGFKPLAKWYRTRSSVLVQNKGFSILVDCSPDFREQALREKIKHIDAVLLTHLHMDATGGLADLRAFTKGKRIPVWAGSQTVREIRKRFDYAFDSKLKTSKPEMDLKSFSGSLRLKGLSVKPIRVLHPPVLTHGFRFKDLAYIPDVKKIPASSKTGLRGIKTLIIGGGSDIPYVAHHTIFDAIKMAKDLNVKKTFFTHIGHRVERMKLKLPRGMALAQDGLKIKF